MLVFCWPALTEGHGSCTLSVWTLAEPLGVLFQARSDNLAPTTRLATAQFTGRSSTQATPSPTYPPPSSFSPPPLFPLEFPLYPPSPLYSTLPLVSTFSISPSMLLFNANFPAFFSLSKHFYDTVVSRAERESQPSTDAGPSQSANCNRLFFWIPEHPDQACLISCFVDRGLAKTTDFKATTFQTRNWNPTNYVLVLDWCQVHIHTCAPCGQHLGVSTRQQFLDYLFTGNHD